jgi:hypothetical protein
MRTHALQIGLLSALCAGTAVALEPDQVFEKVAPSVWGVVTYDAQEKPLGRGSAVVVAHERVVTNCHVLARAKAVVLKRENVMIGAELEFPDTERDLCQLRARNLPSPPAEFAPPNALKIGQRVFAVGNPRGLELTLSDGLVSSLRGGEDGAPLIQTTAPISPGSSGGGLFDSDGRLVGITSLQRRDGQNLNFAYPVDWVRAVPERGKAALAKREAEKTQVAAAATTSGLPPVDRNLPSRMPQVGDTWTYAVVDAKFRPTDRSRKQTYTVRAVTPASITETVTQGGAGLGEVEFRSEIAAYFRAGQLEIAPFAQAFGAMQPGQGFGALPIRGIDKVPTPTGEPAYVMEDGRVLGSEKVTVAAGTFDATRADFRGKVSNAYLAGNTLFRGTQAFTLTVWYAPAVKRVVRWRLEGPNFAEVSELESFSLR